LKPGYSRLAHAAAKFSQRGRYAPESLADKRAASILLGDVASETLAVRDRIEHHPKIAVSFVR
jgi:hypothetical protein